MSSVNRRASVKAVFLLLIIACSVPVIVPAIPHSQASVKSTTSLAPGPKPLDAPLAWKQLVGIYALGETKESFILLERDEELRWLDRHNQAKHIFEKEGLLWLDVGGGRSVGLSESRATDGTVKSFSYLNEVYTRTDAGADPAHYFHVEPTKPVAELRAEALHNTPPKEVGPFRKPDLVELTSLYPGFHLDIRYAQSNNFLSTPVYTQARAFMQRPAAEALQSALKKLQPLGYGLLVHDAYRPWYVTKIFWDATPPKDHNFVADPKKGSKHNRGCAVDITLYDLASGKPIEMPGLYDEMSPRSFPTFPGGTSLQRWHRDLLRMAIESEGFTVDGNEWWHFDYKDWKQYPILNVPFEDLGIQTRAAAQL